MNNFPPEIIVAIAERNLPVPSLKALCEVSRAFNYLVTPLLYRSQPSREGHAIRFRDFPKHGNLRHVRDIHLDILDSGEYEEMAKALKHMTRLESFTVV